MKLTRYLLVLGSLFFLTGCEKTADPAALNKAQQEKIVLNVPSQKTESADSTIINPTDIQIEMGNTHYLFVLADHSTQDLKDLLTRADEIAQN